MNTTAEIVRSVLRWALSIVYLEDSTNGKFAGPRLSQFCLGNLLARTDPATCEAIAREIAVLEKADTDDKYVDSLISCIRASWGATSTTRVRRTGKEDSVMIASRLITAMRQFSSVMDREILETCSVAKTWKKTELYFAGRSWHSIRDDYESIAGRFYLKEKHTIVQTVNHIYYLTLK